MLIFLILSALSRYCHSDADISDIADITDIVKLFRQPGGFFGEETEVPVKTIQKRER